VLEFLKTGSEMKFHLPSEKYDSGRKTDVLI
jgi:hypothetical protein